MLRMRFEAFQSGEAEPVQAFARSTDNRGALTTDFSPLEDPQSYPLKFDRPRSDGILLVVWNFFKF